MDMSPDEVEENAKSYWLKQYAAAASVPPIYSHLTAANLIKNEANREMVSFASRYVEHLKAYTQAGSGAWLVGPPGCGKTAVLCAILNSVPSVCRGGFHAEYVNWAELVTDTAYNPDKRDVYSLVNRIKGRNLLVMDDLGAEKDNQWTRPLVYAVINYRYTHRLPTLFATNLTPDELAAHIGRREVDRMYAMAPHENRITISSDSYRQKPDQLDLPQGAE
jgi:DNA replication protein DnaC